jgi:NAD(P)-dependent dehydrogenase (short-subunit alcohol dehydrogenase family)
MKKGVCVVVGVGPGNGTAIAKKFAAEGYQVALCARNKQRLEKISAVIEGSHVYSYDVQKPEDHQKVFSQIREELGPVKVLIYNAGVGAFSNIEEATPESFQVAWEINARGLFLAAKQALPDMKLNRNSNIVVIGATASVKGGANSAPFSSAKAAQRGLVQSMAKHLGPQKIHVSYVILDGIVQPGKPIPGYSDENFMDPAQIAETVYFLTQQPPQAWTFELDLRTFGERW